MLEFLRTTRVGCMGVGRVPRRIGGRTRMERRAGQGRPRMYLSFFFFLGAFTFFFRGREWRFLLSFPLSLLLVVGGPIMTG